MIKWEYASYTWVVFGLVNFDQPLSQSHYQRWLTDIDHTVLYSIGILWKAPNYSPKLLFGLLKAGSGHRVGSERHGLSEDTKRHNAIYTDHFRRKLVVCVDKDTSEIFLRHWHFCVAYLAMRYWYLICSKQLVPRGMWSAMTFKNHSLERTIMLFALFPCCYAFKSSSPHQDATLHKVVLFPKMHIAETPQLARYALSVKSKSDLSPNLLVIVLLYVKPCLPYPCFITRTGRTYIQESLLIKRVGDLSSDLAKYRRREIVYYNKITILKFYMRLRRTAADMPVKF